MLGSMTHAINPPVKSPVVNVMRQVSFHAFSPDKLPTIPLTPAIRPFKSKKPLAANPITRPPLSEERLRRISVSINSIFAIVQSRGD